VTEGLLDLVLCLRLEMPCLERKFDGATEEEIWDRGEIMGALKVVLALVVVASPTKECVGCQIGVDSTHSSDARHTPLKAPNYDWAALGSPFGRRRRDQLNPCPVRDGCVFANADEDFVQEAHAEIP